MSVKTQSFRHFHKKLLCLVWNFYKCNFVQDYIISQDETNFSARQICKELILHDGTCVFILPYNELAIAQGPKRYQKKELQILRKIQQEKDPDRM